jgi:hypothetical protein
MALFDNMGGLLGNLGDYGFGLPSNTGGLIPDEERDAINKRALLSGLISAGLTYAATPKNLNTGSALPYLGRAGLAGFGASQDVIDRSLNNAYRQKLLAGKEDNIRTYEKDRKKITEQYDPTTKTWTVLGTSALDAPKEETKPLTRTIKRGRQEIFQELQSDGTYKDYSTSSLDAPRQPQETKYSVQTDASGKPVWVPDRPNAPILDQTGKPTTYTPTLSPDAAKRQEKLEKQQDIPNLIKKAKLLLPKATGSGLGAARDIAAATFGQSTEGAQNLASLKAIQAALILKMPRLEGPQGVLDLKLYEAAAGDIGNPFVPAATKLKALETLENFQDKYKNEITQNQPDAQAQQVQQTNATQSGGFKEGAKTKSKSGKPMIFRNSQWEYE